MNEVAANIHFLIQIDGFKFYFITYLLSVLIMGVNFRGFESLSHRKNSLTGLSLPEALEGNILPEESASRKAPPNSTGFTQWNTILIVKIEDFYSIG